MGRRLSPTSNEPAEKPVDPTEFLERLDPETRATVLRAIQGEVIQSPQSNEERMVNTLSNQHPIDGMIGEVFMELGGKAWLKEWAEANPGKFLMMWKGAKPAIAPVSGKSGELVIKIESSLTTTALDDDVVAVQ